MFLFTLAQRTEDDGVFIHSRTKDRGEAETAGRGSQHCVSRPRRHCPIQSSLSASLIRLALPATSPPLRPSRPPAVTQADSPLHGHGGCASADLQPAATISLLEGLLTLLHERATRFLDEGSTT